ncbi:MAG: DUF501 domain-containing protein [Flaviflexus sp.]|nr:DUF501 domain-containing protein [Flaviflexus sp.]
MSVSPTDLEILREQLGRVPRGVVDIAARCACGYPTVVMTAPRLDDGSPFPTTFYLTHPRAIYELSRLEADGVMAELTELVETHEDVAEAYQRAHEDYIARRTALGEVPEIDGISAGGMPNRVKCLHALAGHSLAAGPGVNPIGDIALSRIDWTPETCTCGRENEKDAR